MVHPSTLSASKSCSQIYTLHLITGCISIFKISLTISFIWAVVILFWTRGSEVISKWGLFRYSLAAVIVFLSESLSLLPKALLKFSVSYLKESNCWAVTIALIWATSYNKLIITPNGVVMKEDNIFASVKTFWFTVMGSLGFLSYPSPWAKTHLTPMVQAPVVCQCRQRVVLYFWLNTGFILLL